MLGSGRSDSDELHALQGDRHFYLGLFTGIW